jgi:hypothetical protein
LFVEKRKAVRPLCADKEGGKEILALAPPEERHETDSGEDRYIRISPYTRGKRSHFWIDMGFVNEENGTHGDRDDKRSNDVCFSPPFGSGRHSIDEKNERSYTNI